MHWNLGKKVTKALPRLPIETRSPSERLRLLHHCFPLYSNCVILAEVDTQRRGRKKQNNKMSNRKIITMTHSLLHRRDLSHKIWHDVFLPSFLPSFLIFLHPVFLQHLHNTSFLCRSAATQCPPFSKHNSNNIYKLALIALAHRNIER